MLFIVLSVGCTYLYLRYTPELYNIKASLLIKDDNQSNSNQINQLNAFAAKPETQNEIEILSSKVVMKQVVKDLNLNVAYKKKGWAYNTEIYERLPIKVVFTNNGNPIPANWEVKIISNDTYKILVSSSNTILKGHFGEKKITPSGECVIEKANNFSAYLGKTLYVSISDQDDEANFILKRLLLTPGKGSSSTIDISLNDEIIKRGKDILNDLIDVYNEASITDKNQAIKNSIRFCFHEVGTLIVF
jgi:hypothetical protein